MAGQMLKPLMDIDQQGLQIEVNSYKPGKGLAWSQLFPLKYTPKFDLKGLEAEDGIPVSADCVAFNTRAPKKTRKTIGSWSGKLGKIAVSRDKDEMQINEYQDLQTISNSNIEDKETARYLVDMVYDDPKFCADAMDYRVEVDALRIGSSGKQVLNEGIDGDMATQDEINFNVPEDNFIHATKKWDDKENGDGLADIARGQKLIADKGSKKPMYAIMDEVAFEHLCAQTATLKKVASAALNITGLATSDSVTLDSINAYQRKLNRPQILVVDSCVTIEKKDGTQDTFNPWNVNVCVLSPEPRLGYTYWKRVPQVQNTEALQAYGAYYKVTRYSDVNPLCETTLAEAYVQPALSNRASLVFLNTMNESEWNDGRVADATGLEGQAQETAQAQAKAASNKK